MSLCCTWMKGLATKKKNIGRYPKEGEESEESTEAPNIERGYNTPPTLHTSQEVRSRDLPKSGFVNTSSTNTVNNRQGSWASQIVFLNVPLANTMLGANITLLILNGNGVEEKRNIGFSFKWYGLCNRSKMKK